VNRQADLIRESFDILREMAHPVVLLFYGRLFELQPSLRNLFKADIQAQAQKLVDTLAVVAEAAGDLQALSPVLRQMGRRHASYGVLPEHYDLVATALLWALGQALQENFDRETRAAWTSMLQAVSREMLAGASQGPSAT
jgi:hemoglobin-like flavoprotein